MKIIVLVTTMQQKDASLYKTMNLQTDAIIANQTNVNEIIEEIIVGSHVKLISTNTRGVSRNRNIALMHTPQDADIIVFADDDLVFNDGYENLIITEFENHPKAEAIKFNLHDISNIRKITMKKIEKFERATRRNMSSSGVWGVAIRAYVLQKFNLIFNECFGPGTNNPNGEDTIFLMNIIDNGIRFYRSPIDIAGIDQSESSWFTGHNKGFFETSGMVIDTIYPYISYLIALRSA